MCVAIKYNLWKRYSCQEVIDSKTPPGSGEEFRKYGKTPIQFNDAGEFIRRHGLAEEKYSHHYVGVRENPPAYYPVREFPLNKYLVIDRPEKSLIEDCVWMHPIVVAFNTGNDFANVNQSGYPRVYSPPIPGDGIEITGHSMVLMGYGTNPTTQEDFWICMDPNGYVLMSRDMNRNPIHEAFIPELI
uniref:Uncharacterized protein n=1 Tax=Cannabis sativa TaxID=3483 RepID=A0A803Q0M2_CANSA